MIFQAHTNDLILCCSLSSPRAILKALCIFSPSVRLRWSAQGSEHRSYYIYWFSAVGSDDIHYHVTSMKDLL